MVESHPPTDEEIEAAAKAWWESAYPAGDSWERWVEEAAASKQYSSAVSRVETVREASRAALVAFLEQRAETTK